MYFTVMKDATFYFRDLERGINNLMVAKQSGENLTNKRWEITRKYDAITFKKRARRKFHRNSRWIKTYGIFVSCVRANRENFYALRYSAMKCTLRRIQWRRLLCCIFGSSATNVRDREIDAYVLCGFFFSQRDLISTAYKCSRSIPYSILYSNFKHDERLSMTRKGVVRAIYLRVWYKCRIP